jgi:drug/metabolite transporter (DMT)-like permease
VHAPSGLGAGKSSLISRAWVTHAALVLVQIAFASQAVEAKIAMLPRDEGGEAIFPEALAMLRMFGGAAFFHVVLALRGTHEVAIARADHARLLGLSVLGISLNQTLFLVGLRWTSPFSVSLLGATIPVFAAALAVLLRKEAASLRTFAGLALALGGVLWLIGPGAASALGRGADLGAGLVALNSPSYAAYVVLSRDVVLRVGALRCMAWLFTYGALAFLPLGVVPLARALPELTTRGWLLAGYILVVPTIFAYSINAWALARSSASLVTVYIYLQPLVAALLAWAQLGQTVSARAALAAALILGGLGIVVSRNRGAAETRAS